MILRKIVSITAIICLVFMAGCSREKEAAAAEEIDLSQESKEIEAFGIIKAEETKDVVIDFTSMISDVLVKEGQHVGLHEPLLTLDLSNYHTQVQNSRIELNIAYLEKQRAVNSLLGLSYEDNESGINKLKNDLDYSRNMLEQAVKEFDAMEKLFNEGAVSEDTYRQCKINLEKAKNNVENFEYELKAALETNEREAKQYQANKEAEQNQVDIQTERIKQIEQSMADLENKLKKPYILEDQIVSEFENAAVYDIKYAVGNITDAKQKAFSIVNLDSLIVEANISEEFVKDLKIGESVRIVPVADRAREYEGNVTYISQMAFSSNGETMVPVKISIVNMDSFLRPNYNVDVYIDVQ
ncbi:MAG: efflux RND transporter periplasmic adaptor subunit [Sedimentibacter sp.]|uniref:HlyD family secretion protein n=1 Tax=Sedimentibacter sp. TaxID=1960295 RepID=UPI003158EF94